MWSIGWVVYKFMDLAKYQFPQYGPNKLLYYMIDILIIADTSILGKGKGFFLIRTKYRMCIHRCYVCNKSKSKDTKIQLKDVRYNFENMLDIKMFDTIKRYSIQLKDVRYLN